MPFTQHSQWTNQHEMARHTIRVKLLHHNGPIIGESFSQMVFQGATGVEIRAYFSYIMENMGSKKHDIARKYNISRTSLYGILKKENWSPKIKMRGEDVQCRGRSCKLSERDE